MNYQSLNNFSKKIFFSKFYILLLKCLFQYRVIQKSLDKLFFYDIVFIYSFKLHILSKYHLYFLKHMEFSSNNLALINRRLKIVHV